MQDKSSKTDLSAEIGGAFRCLDQKTAEIVMRQPGYARIPRGRPTRNIPAVAGHGGSGHFQPSLWDGSGNDYHVRNVTVYPADTDFGSAGADTLQIGIRNGWKDVSICFPTHDRLGIASHANHQPTNQEPTTDYR